MNFGRNYSFWPNFCLISAELCSPPFEVQKTEVQKSARNRAFTDWAIGNKYGFGDACGTRQENPELTTLESTPRGCASAEISLDRTRPKYGLLEF